jgi:uncharacterized protein YjbI with pentapeptide repeats
MDIKDISESIVASHADLTGSSLVDVSLANVWFEDVNLTGATFENVNLASTSIENANLLGLHVNNCRLDGMRIEGVLVSDLLATYRNAQ